MGVNISGKGVLAGLASLVTGVINNLTLLASKVLGFTSVTSIPVQRNSLIKTNMYAPLLVSKTENPYTWQEVPNSKRIGNPVYANGFYLASGDSTQPNSYTSLYKSEDAVVWTELPMPLNLVNNNDDVIVITPAGATHDDRFIVMMHSLSLPGDTYLAVTSNGVDFTLLSSSLAEGFVTKVDDKTFFASNQETSFIDGVGNQYVRRYSYTSNFTDFTEYTTTTDVNGELESITKVAKNGSTYGYLNLSSSNINNTTTTKFISSSDLLNWTETEISNFPGDRIHDLFVHENKFIAVTSTSYSSFKIHSSSDGQTWTQDFAASSISSISSKEFDRSFSYESKIAIPVIGTSYLLVSQNGTAWTLEDLGKNIDYSETFIYGPVTVDIPITGGSSYYTTLVDGSGPGFIIGSPYNGTYSISSNKLGDFSGATSPELTQVSMIGYLDPAASAYGNGIYLATGSSGLKRSEDNGATWQNVASSIYSGNRQMSGLAFKDNRFVGIENNPDLGYPTTSYSADGLEWYASSTSTPGEGPTYLIPVASNFFDFVAWKNLDQGGTKIWLSANGSQFADTQATFHDLSSNTFTTGKIQSMVWKNDVQMLVALVEESSGVYALYASSNMGNDFYCSLPSSGGAVNFKQMGNQAQILYAGDTLVQYNQAEVWVYIQGQWFQYVFLEGVSNPNVAKVAYDGSNLVVVGNNYIAVGYEAPYYSSHVFTGGQFSAPWRTILVGEVGSMVETQVAIGDQGSGTAEILAPKDIYVVPAGKTASVDEVRIKNNSSNTIAYDLAVLNAGVRLTDQNVWKNDQLVLAGQTATVTGTQLEVLTAGQRVVVLPSAVDVVEVSVYGTETSI